MNTKERTHRPPTPEAEQVRVNEWNALHEEGTAVTVRLDDGSDLKTTTVSEARLLGGHTAVIGLAGIAGAYRLDRVTAL